jgi:nucleoside-diphosphate-sugar epimerase
MLTGAIIAHPRRAAQAAALASRAPHRPLDVVTDPDPTGPPTGFRTTLLAWSSVPSGSTHHLVLHDDMVLSADLFARAQRAIEAMPDAALALIAFWSSRNGAAVRQAALAGARWVRAVNEYTPANAVILPSGVAQGYARYLRRHGDTWPDDVLLYRYLKSEGVRTLIAVPNLAEHDELPSLINNDNQGPRRSACFFATDPWPDEGEERVADLSAVPFFLHFSRGAALCAVRVQGAVPPRWRQVPCAEYLHRFGISVDRLRSRVDVRRLDADPRVAWEVWLSAYAMGIAERARGAGPAPLPPSAQRILDRALATIVPGGYAHPLPAPAMAQLSEVLNPLIRHGLAAGLADGLPAPRQRRTAASRILVTGGSSYLGEYLVNGLADRGYDVVSFDATPPGATHPDVTYLAGDLCSETDVGRAAKGADAVVHVPGLALADHSIDEAPAHSADRAVEAARTVLAAAAGADAARVLVLSSYRVYAGYPDGQVDEESPFRGSDDPVAVALDAIERDCAARCRVWVLRLGVPYGPGLPAHNPLAAVVRHALLSETIVVPPEAGRRLHLIHLSDVTDAVHAALRGTSDGRTFNVANADPVGIRDLCETVFRIIRPTGVDLPGGAWPADRGPVVSTARARQELGWRPTVDVDYGLHTYVQWAAHEEE